MANESQAEWERRRQPRCLLRKQAELRLADGSVIQGRTEDAGTGGVFFVFDKVGKTLNVGDEARLRLSSPFQEVEEIQCRVAHLREHGVGLQVDTKDGRFGLIVSSDLYMDLQKSVGINIPDRIQVRLTLTLASGQTASGRVKHLTRERVMFHNAIVDHHLLAVGEAVQLTVSCLPLRAVESGGEIISHRLIQEEGLGGRQRQLDYCTVAFKNLSAQQSDHLNAMLSHIQNEEIWGVMKTHTHRLNSHVPKPMAEKKKSTQELYNDFNKFFGFPSPAR